MEGEGFETLSREALLELVVGRAETIRLLRARVEELEGRLSLPPKGPDNSSVPPSLSREAVG